MTAAVRPAPAAPVLARRLIWLALAFHLAAVVIGFGWDRAWHATHPFEAFWSPPHLFIYTMFALAGGTVAALAALPDVRACFGPGFRVPPLPAPIPGPVALAGGGLAAVAAAGLLDSIWHTAFGLDETAWSMPHAMLGWGAFLTFLGLVSCRLALRHRRPLSRYTPAALGLLAALFLTGTLLGPFSRNHTPETVRAVASLPVLAAEADAQHTFRIYLEWNLTRTNPLFVPLSALATGFALALAGRLVPGARTLILLSLAVTLLMLLGERGTARYFGLLDDPAAWLPVPVAVPALVLPLAGRLRLGQRAAWLLAGACFSLLVAAVWGAGPGAVLLGTPAMPAGARAGGRLFHVLDAPSGRGVRGVLILTSLVIPGALGLLDLALRTATP